MTAATSAYARALLSFPQSYYISYSPLDPTGGTFLWPSTHVTNSLSSSQRNPPFSEAFSHDVLAASYFNKNFY